MHKGFDIGLTYRTWEAGYCSSQIQMCYFRTWLFLASTLWLQVLGSSENKECELKKNSQDRLQILLNQVKSEK